MKQHTYSKQNSGEPMYNWRLFIKVLPGTVTYLLILTLDGVGLVILDYHFST